MYLLMIVGSVMSCSKTNDSPDVNPGGNNNGSNNGGGNNSLIWSIPISEVLDGGPGKDGIPALDAPNFINVQNASYLSDSDLVIGFKDGNEVRAYSHIVLDWHEIINDNVGDISLAITYCPLTGTGIGWNRVFEDEITTFGVSGLLYNTNLIPYDRATDSNWSQILNESVNGKLIGQKANLIPLVETNWATWKKMYPNSKVVSTETGHSRSYGQSPYGDYAITDDFFLFPVDKDNRLPLKQRVMALVDDEKAKVYKHTPNEIIEDVFNGKNYLVVNGPTFMVAFLISSDPEALLFEYAYDGTSDVILKDNQNNEWNIFGEAVSGPMEGQKLESAPYFMAYWFSIPAFYETEIYNPTNN